MASMLGERVLPDSVNSRRQRLRSRVQSLREPVRSFREQNVPGPDVIGRLESRAMNLRGRFVTRDGLISRISDMRSGNGSGNSEGSTGVEGKNPDNTSNTSNTL